VWLGSGLLPFQGFPVCGAISVCHARTAASPLVKPDWRVSRIRLTRDRFAHRHALPSGSLAEGLRTSRQSRWAETRCGSKLHV
jgi:hypothetical protein